jgi:hypothetical protein
VRALIDDKGENVPYAGPSVPVEVLGFNGTPDAGDRVVVVPNEARAREVTEYRARQKRERLAARTGPPDWRIEKRYVKVLAENGGADAAIKELQHCLATQWYRADSWKLLSELLAKASRAQEAAEAPTQAQRYDVRLAERS